MMKQAEQTATFTQHNDFYEMAFDRMSRMPGREMSRSHCSHHSMMTERSMSRHSEYSNSQSFPDALPLISE